MMFSLVLTVPGVRKLHRSMPGWYPFRLESSSSLTRRVTINPDIQNLLQVLIRSMCLLNFALDECENWSKTWAQTEPDLSPCVPELSTIEPSLALIEPAKTSDIQNQVKVNSGKDIQETSYVSDIHL